MSERTKRAQRLQCDAQLRAADEGIGTDYSTVDPHQKANACGREAGILGSGSGAFTVNIDSMEL